MSRFRRIHMSTASGGSARAGREGVAITFADPRESRLLKLFERQTKGKIEIAQVPTIADLRPPPGTHPPDGGGNYPRRLTRPVPGGGGIACTGTWPDGGRPRGFEAGMMREAAMDLRMKSTNRTSTASAIPGIIVAGMIRRPGTAKQSQSRIQRNDRPENRDRPERNNRPERDVRNRRERRREAGSAQTPDPESTRRGRAACQAGPVVRGSVQGPIGRIYDPRRPDHGDRCG